MYLFFDTETTGFPPKARMTQLGFMLFDIDGNELTRFNSLIKPDGWEVPNKEYWIREGLSEEEAIKKGGFFDDNNMSTERCEAEGIPVFTALRAFQDNLKKCKYKVAHNLNFDNQILAKEIRLAGIETALFQFKKGYCTMHTTTNLVKAPGKYPGKYKWPKLEELHTFLFGETFDGAHDAFADVEALAKCFFELKNRNLLTI